jgi:hypothetical protein
MEKGSNRVWHLSAAQTLRLMPTKCNCPKLQSQAPFSSELCKKAKIFRRAKSRKGEGPAAATTEATAAAEEKARRRQKNQQKIPQQKGPTWKRANPDFRNQRSQHRRAI